MTTTLNAVAIIPARLASSRFPGKVLARDTGKYLVQHVYERVVRCPSLSRVIIATDSEVVLTACRSFGADAVMTSPAHASGTDRVAEVARSLSADVVINVQGDEPLMEHSDLELLVQLFDGRPDVVMTTLVSQRVDPEGFRDPNIVKAVVAADGHALYFSRAAVPHSAAHGAPAAGARTPVGVEWFQHIGVYGYRRDFLLRLATLPPSPLERREKLEQLRVLEHGFRIQVGVTRSRHLGIDTPEEYRRFVEEYLRGAQNNPTGPPRAKGAARDTEVKTRKPGGG